MIAISRPLSAVERWYWLCDQFSTLNVISRVRVQGEIDLDSLRRGLDELQKRHPLLNTKIAHDDGLNPRWEPCQRSISLRLVEHAKSDQWITEINERELIDRVDPNNGPLIRAVVIQGVDTITDLLIVVPHIIADGTTVLSLAEQWLTLASDPAAPSWIARVLPPAEAMLPLKFRAGEGAAQLAKQTAADNELMANRQPGRVKPTTAIALEERRTQLLHRELDSNQLERLVQTSRLHGTTVHGALTAALVLAAARDNDEQPRYFTVGSPIDFRGELLPAVNANEVGTYVATVPSVVDISQSFWDLARSITTDLIERKNLGHHFNLVTLVVGAAPQSMADARPFMQFMEAHGPINLCSSNIGRYAFPDAIGNLKISDAQFLTAISVNGYFVATINSSHGKLFWNFTYIDTIIPMSRAIQLADNCVSTLLLAI